MSTAKRPGDLEVMSRMANENMDIRMSGTLVKATTVKLGGHITMGVDKDTLNTIYMSALGSDTHYVVLYVINKEQFDKIKNTPL